MFSCHIWKTEFLSCEDALSVLDIFLYFLNIIIISHIFAVLKLCQRGQCKKDGGPSGQGLLKLSVITHKSQHYVITLNTLAA